MKILYVITRSDLGGAQTTVINLANSMCHKHDVSVAAGENGPMWEMLDKRIRKIKIKEIVRQVSLLKDIKAIIKLKKIYNQIEPDVIHLHSSKVGFLGRMAFPKSKIIYTIHGFDSIRIGFRRFLLIEKVLKQRAKYIVAVSKLDAKNLKDEGIYKNVVVIYYGIPDKITVDNNFSKNFSLENAADILNKKKEENKFIILTIARLSPQKRFDLTCEIAQQFSDCDKIQFVWIGNHIKPISTPENLLCLGEIKEAHRLLNIADMFLLTTNYEGMPLVIIEALANGKPVLASSVSGIPEILDGFNGFHLANKSELFVEKIKEFVDGTLDYKEFSINARKTYERGFALEVMYNNYENLYMKIYNTKNK